MSEATTTIHEAFRDLPADERIRIVQELWDRIAKENASELPIAEWQARVLDERLASHRENPGAARPWAEVRDELLARLRRE